MKFKYEPRRKSFEPRYTACTLPTCFDVSKSDGYMVKQLHRRTKYDKHKYYRPRNPLVSRVYCLWCFILSIVT